MPLLQPTEELKFCPRCKQHLPSSDFGVCRARKDGLNLYDRLCIRQKIAASRQALREYKQARVAAGHKEKPKVVLEKVALSPARIARILRKLSPADRVREAIRCGAHTQKEIAQVTKLPKDEIGNALASLLLWTKDIRSEVVGGQRLYLLRDGPSVQANPAAQLQLVPSFSGIAAMMPGSKRCNCGA